MKHLNYFLTGLALVITGSAIARILFFLHLELEGLILICMSLIIYGLGRLCYVKGDK